jgi:hypothetical protein
MNDRAEKNLGPPDIKLAGLQIWIHGRQFPNTEDYWDSNWLRVTAHCGSGAASVWTGGAIIHLSEVHQWHSELAILRDTLSGEAALKCMEPELSVTLKAGSLGHISMEVSITPEHLAQEHWFKFEIDQTYLPPLVQQCADVLATYPLKGKR